jgi:hypothetical protein
VDGTELYDLLADSSEKKNIAPEHPDITAQLRQSYEAWFEDVGRTRGYEPQRLYLGSGHENPVTLTPQDWRGPQSRFVSEDSIGHWLVDVRKGGTYNIVLHFREAELPCRAHISIGTVSQRRPVEKGTTQVTFTPFSIEAGNARLDAWLDVEDKKVGVRYAVVKRL